MTMQPRTRRILSTALILWGAALMFLAPEHVWVGGLMAGIGVLVEFAGIYLGHH